VSRIKIYIDEDAMDSDLQLRRILRLHATMTAARMRNQVELLGNWG
jgi:hypothetical protein